MKTPLIDAMGKALALVKTSNLAEATQLLRRAVSGGATAERRPGESAIPAPHLRTSAFAPASRAPLGEVLRALRTGRANLPKMPFPNEETPKYPLDEKFTARTYRGRAGSLDYRLYVPTDLTTRKPALLLMLHGCTQDPEDFAIGTQMNRLADEFGLVVAYPHQPRTANPSGCWNWFDTRHQNRGSGEPAALAGLTQSLVKEFGVARERTFAAGLSAGGAMAEVLAATYSDVFSAVGIHSGLPFRAAKDVPSAFAAMKGAAVIEPPSGIADRPEVRRIVFHGDADATVAPVNGIRILDQARSGSVGLQEVDFNQEIDGRLVERRLLQNSAGEAVAELWSVEGGGHGWFGGDHRGSYTESVGLDASRIMVQFFLRE
jgi:poly(hydroxyalkanoate) depolymerase family esterase